MEAHTEQAGGFGLGMVSLDVARRQVAEYMKRLYEIGFVLDQEGNISTRAAQTDRFVITPSQVPRYLIEPADILVVNGQGGVVHGRRNPSIETGMHLLIYSKRPDVRSVMHFHSLHATALAALHETIPPILEELIPFLGEDVRTVSYATAGTDELASSVADGLAERNAVLLANHGAVVCGKSLQDAFHKARLLEKTATIYAIAKSVGEPKRLPDSSIEMGRDLFRTMLL